MASFEDLDSQTQLLVSMLKNTNGQINFQGVASDMGLSSAGAAQKRVKRYLEKLSPGAALVSGSTLGTGIPVSNSKTSSQQTGTGDGTASPKIPKTPKTPGSSKIPKSNTKRQRDELDEEQEGSEPEQKKIKAQEL